MYTSKQQLVQDVKMLTATTQTCINELTDESLSQAVSEKDRTLGEIAWHITTSVVGFANQAGLKAEGAGFGADMPESAEAMKQAYQENANAVIKQYEALTDEDLMKEVDFFGHPMPMGALLSAYTLHEVHHRGQMTVLMRQADLKVPSIYGPSRDAE